MINISFFSIPCFNRWGIDALLKRAKNKKLKENIINEKLKIKIKTHLIVIYGKNLYFLLIFSLIMLLLEGELKEWE